MVRVRSVLSLRKHKGTLVAIVVTLPIVAYLAALAATELWYLAAYSGIGVTVVNNSSQRIGPVKFIADGDCGAGWEVAQIMPGEVVQRRFLPKCDCSAAIEWTTAEGVVKRCEGKVYLSWDYDGAIQASIGSSDAVEWKINVGMKAFLHLRMMLRSPLRALDSLFTTALEMVV